MAAFTPRESVALKARNKRQTTAIPVPEVQQYGVFTPGYAGYLQSTAAATGPTDSAALAAGNAAALRMNADAEQAAYANMLGRAQQLQIEAQKRDLFAERESDIGGRNLDYTKEGIGGIETVETDPVTGESRIVRNPVQQQIGNVYNLGMKRAETIDKMASGFKTLGETGTIPSEEAKSHLLRDPVTGEPMELVPGMNVSDEIDAYTEDTPEDRLLRDTTVAKINAESKDGAKVEQIYNTNGTSMGLKWTGPLEAIVRGQAEARAAGIDPTTGRPLGRRAPTASPNAGAQGGGASATSAAEPVRGDLSSYRDAGYDAIENRLERKYNLPQGLMKRIRVYGEKSNANQVSPTGARTVYQILPSTRKLFGDKYKIDAYAGPAQAAEVAALHLKESIDRGEDPVLGYNAGPKSTGRWNSREAREYKQRVDSPQAYASVRPSGDPNNIRVTRLRALPFVSDVSVGDDGIITAKLKNGRVVKYGKGRRVG